EAVTFPKYASALQDLIMKTGAKLVIIDPLVAYLDRTVASYNDQSVRRVLAILKDLAEEHNCAMLLIRHLTKDEDKRTIYRGGGSIGFVAAVRCVWVAASVPKEENLRVLIQVKNNIEASPAGLTYQIPKVQKGVPHIE